MMQTSTILSTFIAFIWSGCVVVRCNRRCKVVAPWNIGGGNPVMGNEGFTTIMYILSKNRRINAYQLGALNEYAIHYKTRTKERVRIMALNPYGHGFTPVTDKLRRRYENIRIFQEPNDGQRIFKRLGGDERDILIYDECSRLNFQYGFPYSFMGFPWVSKATSMVIYNHDRICGPCVSRRVNSTTDMLTTVV